MGRKKIIIDWNRIEKMAISGANGRQISASIGIHYNTLVNKCKAEKKCDFSDFLQTKKQRRPCNAHLVGQTTFGSIR